MTGSSRDEVLLVRAGERLCALHVADVLETFRPVAVTPLAGTPPFVLGAAVVRGGPVPVISLEHLLTGRAGRAPVRYVSVRCGAGHAVLAVDAVLGVAPLPPVTAQLPLLEQACAGALEAAGALGRELVVLLRSARLVPEEAWRALRAAAPGAP